MTSSPESGLVSYRSPRPSGLGELDTKVAETVKPLVDIHIDVDTEVDTEVLSYQVLYQVIHRDIHTLGRPRACPSRGPVVSDVTRQWAAVRARRQVAWRHDF